MKRLVSIALTAALAFASPLALVACGQKGGSEPATTTTAATTEFATLGDVLAANPQGTVSTFDEQNYVCAFSVDGTWWRVTAALPEGMYDELDAVWFEDQAKVEELIAPLEVTDATILDAPSEDDLAALVGKTGADLTADGFTFMAYSMVVNGNETDCVATKESFNYLITFDGTVPDENTDDPAGAVKDLTVNNAAIQNPSWDVLTAE